LGNQNNLHGNSFIKFAETLGLNIEQFNTDSKEEMVTNKVEADFESGVMSGVNGTPSIYVNGKKYNEPVETPYLINYINALMQ
jgi:protein-disulfide isomerase